MIYLFSVDSHKSKTDLCQLEQYVLFRPTCRVALAIFLLGAGQFLWDFVDYPGDMPPPEVIYCSKAEYGFIVPSCQRKKKGCLLFVYIRWQVYKLSRVIPFL